MKIALYEKMLKQYKQNAQRLMSNTSPEGQKEYRLMLLKMSQTKDQLLDEYRKMFVQSLKKDGKYGTED